MKTEKPLSEKQRLNADESYAYTFILTEDVSLAVKELKKSVKIKLRKLGVRVNEEDGFDIIGVDNAIYSVLEEIDKIMGDFGEKEK